MLIKRSSRQRKVDHRMLALLSLCHHLPLHHIKGALKVFAQSTIHASPRILKHPLPLVVVDYGCFLSFSWLHGPFECVMLPLNDHAVIRNLILHPLHLQVSCSRLLISFPACKVILRDRQGRVLAGYKCLVRVFIFGKVINNLLMNGLLAHGDSGP
jgi:hypothetical protein